MISYEECTFGLKMEGVAYNIDTGENPRFLNYKFTNYNEM